MAGLTRAQREAKKKTEETVKITGVKQEVVPEFTKVKLNIENMQKKYGCVPTVIYIGGSRIYFSEQEIKLRSNIAELLKQEGLI